VIALWVEWALVGKTRLSQQCQYESSLHEMVLIALWVEWALVGKTRLSQQCQYGSSLHEMVLNEVISLHVLNEVISLHVLNEMISFCEMVFVSLDGKGFHEVVCMSV